MLFDLGNIPDFERRHPSCYRPQTLSCLHGFNPLLEYLNCQPQGVHSLLVLHVSHHVVPGRVSPDAALSLDLFDSGGSLEGGDPLI